MAALEKEFLERIEKHKGMVFRISRMYMDHPDDQKDLFQEITFQAWKSYPRFEGKSEFSTWLYRIALNTAIIFLRSEKKKSNLIARKENEEIGRIQIRQEEYQHEDDFRIKVMYQAIHQLSAIDKALLFFYLEDIPGKQMAEQLGISEGNARVKLNRAKEKLKKRIEKLAPESD